MTCMSQLPGLMKCHHPMSGPEQTWLRGQHTGTHLIFVNDLVLKTHSVWEISREAGPLWTVTLKRGAAS